MLKKYDDLRKIDVSKWTEKRDKADYLNWAKVIDLLHENGAEKVYFEPIINRETGSSLYMVDKIFTDKNGNTNQVYETAIKIVIDDLEFIQRGPVMNGASPVKDNSMSQQRLWNCQTRLFVKGVAIRTGLGFDLWLKEEFKDEKSNWEDDLMKHDIFKIKDGLSVKEIAEKLHKTEDEVRAIFSYFDTLNNFERDLANIDTKSR